MAGTLITDQSQSVAYYLYKVGLLIENCKRWINVKENRELRGSIFSKQTCPLRKKILLVYTLFYSVHQIIFVTMRAFITGTNYVIDVKTKYTFMSQPLTRPYLKCRCRWASTRFTVSNDTVPPVLLVAITFL